MNPFDSAMNVYTYSRLAAVEYGSPLGLTMREGYKYHQAGAVTLKRLESGQLPSGFRLEAGYTYDNEGRMVTTTYPNGGQIYTTAYDLAGRPSGLTHVA